MPFIYCLASEDEVLYVGRTNDLKKREHNHRSKYNSSYSRFIPKNIIWKFICLEEVAEEDAFHAEGFYYHYLQPTYNKKVPGRTRVEFCQSEAFKESEKKRHSDYYFNHTKLNV